MKVKLEMYFDDAKGPNCLECRLARIYQGTMSCLGAGNPFSVGRYVLDPGENGYRSLDCPLVEDNAE